MTSEEEKKLNEMAEVFHLPKKVRMRYIWLPVHSPALSEKLSGKKRKRETEK